VTPRCVEVWAPGSRAYAVLVRLGKDRRWADVRVAGVTMRFRLVGRPAPTAPRIVLVRMPWALLMPRRGAVGERMED